MPREFKINQMVKYLDSKKCYKIVSFGASQIQINMTSPSDEIADLVAKPQGSSADYYTYILDGLEDPISETDLSRCES